MQYPLSDGSPFVETAVALGLIAGFGFAGTLSAVQRGYAWGLRSLADALRRTGIFAATDLKTELQRLDLLRIVLGVLALGHYLPELVVAVQAGSAKNALLFGLTVGLTGLLTIGLFTPLAALLLALLLNTIVANLTLNISIGALAIAMCLIPMIAAPAGHTISVDAVLMRRGKWGAPVRRVYGLWGRPDIDRAQIGRFLVLLAFGAINVYSGLNHLGSETWRAGLTTGTILLFPVINPDFHWISEWIYARVPWLYVGFSMFTTWGMLVWQLFLVPLALLSRWTRLAVIVWGLLFFAFSAHVLAIKTLGIYEYVLFALIFWSPRRIWLPDLSAAWSPPDLPARNSVFGAICITFVLLLAGFMVRLPALPESLSGVAAFSREVFGRSPMVFGMGVIDVFNEHDLRIYRSEASVYVGDPQGGVPLTNRDLSEVSRSKLTQDLRVASLKGLYCSPEFAKTALTALAQEMPAADPRRNMDVTAQFSVVTHPTAQDMLAFRYAPTTWEEVCSVHGRIDAPDDLSIHYSKSALEGMKGIFGFIPSNRQAVLATKFPCALEYPKMLYWFDIKTRSKEDLAALVKLVEAADLKSIGCVFAFKEMAERLSEGTPYLIGGTICETEIEALDVYEREVFDEQLKALAGPATLRARAALSAGQQEPCRAAVAEVRKLYLQEVFDRGATNEAGDGKSRIPSGNG